MIGRSVRRGALVVAAAVALAGCAATTPDDSAPPSTTATAPSSAATALDGALVLDPSHDYGERYADGILPVGDEHWSLSDPAVGTVYLCRDVFVPDDRAGAQTRGPWFVNGDTEYDLNLKVHVEGRVDWEPRMSVTVADGIRTVSTNDLPDHATGEFPIAADDPAHAYDANPNSIAEQDLTYRLTADPEYGDPQCMGGEAGVMLTGVALFNAFDAGGRDAGAWEVQDDCEGHPQEHGEYHYHTLSSCIGAVGVDTVIGYALDGFPITGPTVGPGNVLITADLDACHGIVSEIELDGTTVTTYHYVMTQDFPYSVSCFRAAPVRTGPPPAG
ncbi:MAG: YHYH protein [Actinomycetales bacterium]|nr:YHYH protein [Actinomycetales bacterium]